MQPCMRMPAHATMHAHADPPLQKYVPPEHLVHVQRVLYGQNCGTPVADRPSPLDPALEQASKLSNWLLSVAAFFPSPFTPPI